MPSLSTYRALSIGLVPFSVYLCSSVASVLKMKFSCCSEIFFNTEATGKQSYTEIFTFVIPMIY